MYQQINLYQPVFRRQQKVFSAVTLLQVLLVSALLMTAFYAHARWTLSGLQATEASLDAGYRNLEARLGILEGEHVTPAEELDRLQHAIEERRALLDRMTGSSIDRTGGFSSFFELLANHTVPGLWLTGIRLSGEGETELRGMTVDPELVPGYLQALPHDPRTRALRQGSVQLARRVPGDPAVEFILSSDSEEALQP